MQKKKSNSKPVKKSTKKKKPVKKPQSQQTTINQSFVDGIQDMMNNIKP